MKSFITAFQTLLFGIGTFRTVLILTILVMVVAVAVTTVTWNIIDSESVAVGNYLAIVITGILTPIVTFLFSAVVIKLKCSNDELKQALSEVKELQSLLPICASCKKVREDDGYWLQIEGYISKHTKTEFSHSICPDCKEELYGDFLRDIDKQKAAVERSDRAV